MDVLALDATDQLGALAAGRIGARELLEAAIAQADRVDSRLNAVVARDPERALAAARSIDERRVRGEVVGPLAGLPMTVKDTIDVEHMPASGGLRSLLGRDVADAPIVERIRSAGAVIWGKTNTPARAEDWQTYNDVYGTTCNPWNRALTPGGSSGGSTTALAALITSLEIGGDIGGSLRVPAGFCGVLSHKPTHGLVPQRGLVPPVGHVAVQDLAVVGPMARSARDLRLLLSIVADSQMPAQAPAAELKGLRVRLWLDEPGFVHDPASKDVLEAFAGRLADAGAIVRRTACPVDAERLLEAYVVLLLAILGADLPLGRRALLEALRGPAHLARALGADALSRAHCILAYTARHREWLDADETRAELCAAVRTFFESADVLIAPISPTAAFPHDHRPIWLRSLSCSDGRRIRYLELLSWVALATACRLPATVVPAGLDARGLPVGVQIIGPEGGDATTLAVAQAIDEQIGGFRAPPLA